MRQRTHTSTAVIAAVLAAGIGIAAPAPAHAQIRFGLSDLLGGGDSKPTAQWSQADAAGGPQRLTGYGVDQFTANAAWAVVVKMAAMGDPSDTETFGDFNVATRLTQTQNPQNPNAPAYIVKQRILGTNGAQIMVEGGIVWLGHGWQTAGLTFTPTAAPQQAQARTQVAPVQRPPQPVAQAAPSAPPAPPRTPHPPTNVEALDDTMIAAKNASVRPDCTGDFPAVATIKAGDSVAVTGKAGGCYRIDKGWVLASSLKAADAAPAQQPAAPAPQPPKAPVQPPAQPSAPPAQPAPASVPTPPPPPASGSTGAVREQVQAAQPAIPAPTTPAPAAQPAPAAPATPPAPPPAPAKPKVQVVD